MNQDKATGETSVVETIEFAYERAEHAAPGRQGGHMTVVQDYR